MLQRSVSGLAVQLCIICSPLLAQSGAVVEGKPAPGEWSQWSPWTPCSAECRTGITTRSRTCRPSPLLPLLSSGFDDKITCPGQEKEIKLCNKQDCPKGKKGWREQECSQYDDSVHSGRRYTWEPFTHPSDPCALTCRAKGHHFYTTLTDRVIDGTPCGGASTSPSAVCLQGVCEEVGCDDLVGSPWRRDACGVCKGDNSTCRTVSGVFTEMSLSRGMNQIVIIPARSTLIRITGLQYSINWLALQNERGDYILNGGEMKSPAGDYEAAGTIFSYKTSQKCSGQCITAQGPINQEMRVMLKTRGTNRGVQYSFNVPLDVTDDYFRHIIDPSRPTVTPHNTSPPALAESASDENQSEDERLAANAENDSLGDKTEDALLETIDPNISASEEQREERGGELEEQNEEVEGAQQLEQQEYQESEDQPEEHDEYNSVSKEVDGFYVDDADDGFEEEEEEYEEEEEEDEVEEPNVDAFDDTPLESDDDDIQSVSSMSGFNENLISEGAEEETNADDTIYQSDDDGNDEEEDEEVWEDDDDLADEFEVGAPEPIRVPVPKDDKIKIIRKARPTFIDFDDQGRDAFVGNAKTSAFESNIRSDPYDDDDLILPQGSRTSSPQTTDSSGEEPRQPFIKPSPSPSTSPHSTTTPQTTSEQTTTQQTTESQTTSTEQPTSTTQYTTTSQHVTTEDESLTNSPTTQASRDVPLNPDSSSSNRRQSDIGVIPKQPSRSGHTLHSQNNHPSRPHTIPPQPYRHSNRGRSFRRRFRRPNYSQSFTFRRRYMERAQAENQAPARHGSRSRPDNRLEHPRITSSRINTPSSNLRRVRVRIRTPPQGERAGGSVASRQSFGERNPYHRTPSRNERYHRRRPSQRQALTLGHSASRDEDGFLTIPAVNRRSHRRPLPSGGGSSSSSNPRQHSRQEDNRRHQQDNSRQQREYARQQEEYRRELRRRRQQMEHERAKAEYQRRLEEHNRRLQQRKLEQQRRHNQYNNNQNRRRHHHRHHKDGRHGHQQHGHHDRQQNVHISPTGGRGSRVDSSGNAASPQRGRESGSRQRTPVNRIPPSPVDITIAPVPGSRTESGAVDSPTLAPTRDFLTNPGGQPVNATVPTLVGSGPDPPQFIREESRHDSRSGLHAPSSNELPNEVITPLVIGPQGNVVPTVNERGLVIGGEGNLVARGDDRDKMSYEWRVSGLTECTLTCGGGLQQTAVVCLDMRTQAVVTNGNCAHVPRPEIQTVTCNTRPCPAEWQGSQWSACSASCGPGQQTRLVTCSARISPTLNLTRPEENCQGLPKPESRRQCQSVPCTAWKIGNWSQCSVQCGEGVRTRDVYCADHTGFDVSDDLCPGSKPSAEEGCEIGPCGKGWYYTSWPDQCPARCGSGSMSRRVACVGEGGQPLPLSSCDRVTRPDAQQPCKSSSPCGGQWFTGEWEQCNVTCGRGHQNREVLCVKNLPGGLLTVVDDENCNMAAKPITVEPCQLDACSAEWYMTSWTQCSKSCGTGQRTREVKCLDPQQRASSDCPLAEKPRTREACNTQSCATRPPPSSSFGSAPASAGSECQDTFSRCEIVRHARMCRYPFYKKKCCATCAEDT